MTYIELINNFWDSTRFNPCTSNEAAMYLYMLHECNIRRWINPFEFRTRNLEMVLGLSRTTITALRNKLKQRGLIDFTKGMGKGKPLYLVIGAEITDKKAYEKFGVQSVDTKVDTKKFGVQSVDTKVDTKKFGVQSVDTKVDTNANSTLLNTRLKTKDISPDGDSTVLPQPATSLFAEEEMKASRRKPKAPPPPPSPPPTLEDVMQYFLSQDADKRLENWEESARRFFDNFNAVDWRDKFNRRITRWDSRANSWILDDEKRQKERITPSETKQADKLSERRGTEPNATSRKGFKGTF